MDPITPCLWITDGDLDAAADYYCGAFPDGRRLSAEQTSEQTMALTLELNGQPLMLINGGGHEFVPNEAVSLSLVLDDQAEVDHYWDYFTKEGEGSACGWLKDRYGFAWQVTPRRLVELLASDDPEAVGRVVACFMKVHGRAFDIAELEAAHEGPAAG